FLLTKLRDVPILNSDAYKLLHYTSQPEADFKKLEEMIRDNAGLCSQFLRVANSSLFYRPTKVDTITQALVKLGFLYVRQILIYNFYNSVLNLFRAQKEVIEHAKGCATISEFVCKNAVNSPDEWAKIRLGGLMHDIGSQALAFFFPEQYEKVLHESKGKTTPLYLSEIVVFGTEHQAVGRILAQKWNFPEYLSTIIGDHHYLFQGKWNGLTLPVYCADNFLNQKAMLPFVPFDSQLSAYFAKFGKEIPWKNVPEEFSNALLVKPEIDLIEDKS
ncbi:HDOD domain-containing protein, partial [bacterium]|nr:HDOD domain-containing protein [bacterium]